MAASTCDGAILPEEQDEPELTMHAVQVQRDQRMFPPAGPAMAKLEVLHSRSALRAEDHRLGHAPFQRRSRSGRADAAMRARSPSPSCQRACAAAPKPAMPERFSVPARRPFCWPPPTSCGAKRRAVAHHQRARRLAARPACAPTASCNRTAKNPDRSCRPPSPHPPAAARPLRAPGARLRRWAAPRRSHCWRPSPPPGRGPCLRAAPRAALRDRSRRRP